MCRFTEFIARVTLVSAKPSRSFHRVSCKTKQLGRQLPALLRRLPEAQRNKHSPTFVISRWSRGFFNKLSYPIALFMSECNYVKKRYKHAWHRNARTTISLEIECKKFWVVEKIELLKRCFYVFSAMLCIRLIARQYFEYEFVSSWLISWQCFESVQFFN